MTRLTLLLACSLLAGCAVRRAETTTAQKAAPPNAEAVKLFVSGARELNTGQAKLLGRAEELLRKAIAMDPNLWEAHYDLGIVLRRRGELDPACASLTTAHGLAADAPEPIMALAECNFARGDLGTANTLLSDFVKKNKGHIEARLSLAAVLRKQGELDDALAQAREVLVRNPNETRALVEVARAYRAKKEADVALLVLEKARVIDDKSAAVQNELGLLALERGDTQLAFTHFAKASELDPKLASAHMNQGSVLLRAGDFEAAERAYRAAVAADPASADANIGLAIALRGRGQHKQAETLYERVLEADPSAIDAMFDLAVLRADFLDRRREALPLFEKYLKLAPKNDSHREAAQRYVQDIGMAKEGAQ